MNEQQAHDILRNAVKQNPAVGNHLHETVRRIPAVKPKGVIMIDKHGNPTIAAWLLLAVLVLVGSATVQQILAWMFGG